LIADLELNYISYGDNSGTTAIPFWKDQITDAGTLSWNALFTKVQCIRVLLNNLTGAPNDSVTNQNETECVLCLIN